ncbi:MAG: TlpA family protein disulfide reductase [Phycisphaeraceae bacterium]
MNKLLSLIMLLLVAALLPGCEEEPSINNGPELLTEDELPGVLIESPDDLKKILDDHRAKLEAHTIPVVDAAAITDLRKQAASDGKVLVVDCWATWCGSCVAMFPHLHKAMKERGDDVLLVSLTFDEGEDLAKQAAAFLNKQKATDNAYIAAEGSDAKDAIAKALSDTWDGGALPAVFVYKPDGTTAYEMLETRGKVQEWVDRIAAAVDQAMSE